MKAKQTIMRKTNHFMKSKFKEIYDESIKNPEEFGKMSQKIFFGIKNHQKY